MLQTFTYTILPFVDCSLILQDTWSPSSWNKVEAKSCKSKGKQKNRKFSWVENDSIAIYINFLVKTLNFTLTWKNTLPYFPSFYKYILKLWSKCCLNQLSLPSTVISQHLIVLYRLRIKLFFIRRFWEKIFLNDLVKENGKFKTREQITHELKIDKNLYFKWIQLVHARPNYWKETFTESKTVKICLI